MISNPAQFFVTGSDQKEFTYEGGKNLYHFSPHDSGLSTYMEFNIVFFANSVEHAKDVLERMLNFAIDCKAEYFASHNNSVHAKEFRSKAEDAMNKFSSYLKGKDKWILTKAPVNQFYKVGWADNDTF